MKIYSPTFCIESLRSKAKHPPPVARYHKDHKSECVIICDTPGQYRTREDLEKAYNEAKKSEAELRKIIDTIPTSMLPTLKYKLGTILAEKDFVIVHGRFSGFGEPVNSVNWIAADILRIKDGFLVEHRDVIQDEASRESSKSGLPMFGEEFDE